MNAGQGRRIIAAAPREPRCFFSGTERHPVYVDHFEPASQPRAKLPVVMAHGGGHSGACFIATPDGRPGWAPRFAEAGHHVFVPDWPGHGRSPMRSDFATLSTRDIAESLMLLVERIGPAIVLVHSASGPIAWWMAERRPEIVAAIVGLAPGPPANLLPDLPDDPAAVERLRHDENFGCPIYAAEHSPVWMTDEFMATFWANAPRFPRHAFENYRRSIVPESARVLNERFNVGGRGLKIDDPRSLHRHDILIVTGDHDPRHPQKLDRATAEYLGAEFLWLADAGISGNGHLMMIEDNSDALAALVLDWLGRKGH